VFEIGNSLREARLRQGLDFPEIEHATKIRSKYLRALEDENFEQLPAQTYVKGFLRTYADYLNLEGQLYVDEYNSRFVTDEDSPLRVRGGGAAWPNAPRLHSSAVLIALTAIGLATALVIAAWKFGAADDPTLPELAAEKKQPQRATKRNGARTGSAAARKKLTVRIAAVRGDSWLEVYRSSSAGAQEWEGTLARGKSQVFVGHRFWIRAGAPSNLRIKLNGRIARIPPTDDATDFMVTRRGLTVATPA
jgi:cytoskeleton protein RodZ